jgi:hypothetical protein
MEPSIERRERAARCLELSRSNLPPDDVAFLETLAAALIQDAERSEHAETVQLAGRYANSQSAVVARAAESRHADLKPDTSTDRRRPGRRDEVNPALIPLLREESNEGLPLERADDGFDSLRGSRGIIIWTLVAAAGWVSFGLWFALGR